MHLSIWTSFAFYALATLLQCCQRAASGSDIPPPYRVHAFYYLWYGEPSTGTWAHWDHEVLSHWDPNVAAQYPQGMRFEPPDCLHSPFYPLRGPYSSASTDLIRQHLREMEAYGIGVLVASWWGPSWRQGSHDTQRINTDDRIAKVIREIEVTGSPVRVAFHLEPYEGRTKETVHADLSYLSSRYGQSSAVLRINGRPAYYVYDSYRLPASDWAQLLLPGAGPLSVRGTPADGFFLGLWLNKNDGDDNILPGGFEGFYTYFSSEQVSYGSNPQHWPAMQMWATRHGRIFVPSIGPGYNDGKIRPWNLQATRTRDDGDRYRRLWDIAIALGVPFVSITSYNEWGEGTQIEPAVPRLPRQECAYLDYEPQGAYLYLEITRNGTQRLAERLAPGSGEGEGTEGGGVAEEMQVEGNGGGGGNDGGGGDTGRGEAEGSEGGAAAAMCDSTEGSGREGGKGEGKERPGSS
ncbi:hypothetical protein Agub_g1338 [Astrephomene gubernaculifera]|uniref:Glycoprotein endo-alpha-1,2-mannosidase-like protein n=1 Tax=Astrephomene gubernaculifera TaxID=47775 RepID=A0AAD3HGR2_9CHLO|nr:hypothetical protein Agub_g1338 [Astrephomene gubernaculifera]